MKTKEVLSLGQFVYIGNADKRDIKGEITAICIRHESVRYEITWWKEDSRKSEWVCRDELCPCGEEKKSKLGFST